LNVDNVDVTQWHIIK